MNAGCEPNEVYVASLPPGAAFEVVLSRTTSIYGIVRKHLAGSVLVDTDTDANEHFQFEAPVVAHTEVSDAEQWLISMRKGEHAMANGKEKKAKAVKEAKEPKTKGRKPVLAPFVDGPFKLYATYKDKEYTAQVLGSGVIMLDEKEYTSPSGAAVAITGKPTDGYVFWQFNKNDKRVSLDEIRGSKSPLAEPKTKKVAA